ncbi:MAG TPA: hypothetical protein VFV87_08100 [Pirellulaceae bacterium]|nr:hypothetical protein [Pirellulaceae bacterium]
MTTATTAIVADMERSRKEGLELIDMTRDQASKGAPDGIDTAKLLAGERREVRKYRRIKKGRTA